MSLVVESLQNAAMLPQTNTFSPNFWKIFWLLVWSIALILIKMALLMVVWNSTIPKLTNAAINKITITDAFLLSLLLSFII
jgi:hypothetical protein